MRRAITCAVSTAVLMSLGVTGAFAQAAPSTELHGYMQNRLYANPNGIARFATFRVSLSATAKLANDRTAYVEYYLQPWVTDKVLGNQGSEITAEQGRTYLESAYLDTPFADGRLRIGKGRQLNFGMLPNVANRKTTEYNILAETFSQDRIQGFQYSWKKGLVDGGLSLYTDPRLETRKIGDTPGLNGNATVSHFVEKDDNANLSGRLAVAGRYGWSGPAWKLHASGSIGRLVQEDADRIATAYNTATTDRTHTKYGVDTQYAKKAFVASGEYYVGNFSFLSISGYSVMVGYEPKDSRRVYLRYSALNNDQTPQANQQSTWNTQQVLLGVVQPISKGVWVEMDYERNMESPAAGNASVDNDMLIFEVFTGF